MLRFGVHVFHLADGESCMESMPHETHAGWFARFGRRFIWLYLVGFIFPFPLDQIPYDGLIPFFQCFFDAKNQTIQYIGQEWLKVDVVIQATGSGDTMRNYLGCLCLAIGAMVLSLPWSLLDRRGKADRFLAVSLRIYVRFFLAVVMIQYGLYKVFPLQFIPPTLMRLEKPLGEFSPMGLLWTFMGFSQVYCCFTGVAETLGGLLLTMRRTTMLGALVVAGFMGNVVMMNLCFDVPVKLYSMHYLGMALLLLLPDAGRLSRFFVLGKPVPPRPDFRFTQPRWLHPLLLTFRSLLVLAFFAQQFWDAWTSYQGSQTIPAFHGCWSVAKFLKDGQEQPDDEQPKERMFYRWEEVMIERGHAFLVRFGDTRHGAPMMRYVAAIDQERKTIELKKYYEPDFAAQWRYEQPAPGELHLHITWEEHAYEVHLKLKEPKPSALMNRGFHWVQELPFNR